MEPVHLNWPLTYKVGNSHMSPAIIHISKVGSLVRVALI